MPFRRRKLFNLISFLRVGLVFEFYKHYESEKLHGSTIRKVISKAKPAQHNTFCQMSRVFGLGPIGRSQIMRKNGPMEIFVEKCREDIFLVCIQVSCYATYYWRPVQLKWFGKVAMNFTISQMLYQSRKALYSFHDIVQPYEICWKLFKIRKRVPSRQSYFLQFKRLVKNQEISQKLEYLELEKLEMHCDFYKLFRWPRSAELARTCDFWEKWTFSPGRARELLTRKSAKPVRIVHYVFWRCELLAH